MVNKETWLKTALFAFPPTRAPITRGRAQISILSQLLFPQREFVGMNIVQARRGLARNW